MNKIVYALKMSYGNNIPENYEEVILSAYTDRKKALDRYEFFEELASKLYELRFSSKEKIEYNKISEILKLEIHIECGLLINTRDLNIVFEFDLIENIRLYE